MSDKNTIQINIIGHDLDMAAARTIREIVFVVEQEVPPEIEYDEFEESSTHILARLGGQAVGTARWRETKQGYKLERFAVLAEYRGLGVGARMVSYIISQINSGNCIYLNSQVSAINFYSRLGFQATSDIFYEAAIPHRKMVYNPQG